MKVKIKSLQGGGGFATFTPIIHTPPAVQSPSSGANAQAEMSSMGSSLLDEKMLEHLYKTGGLVNDVNKLVSELIQLERTSDLPYLKTQNRSSALQIVAKINEINQNKKNWDDAIQRSKEAGGLGEVAVDTYGRVFTKDRNNKIQSLSLSDYSARRNETKLLSVQELMYERQYNPSLTGQNGVFTVADNAIGLNKITTHIKDLISALGTEKIEDSKFYSKAQADQYLKQLGAKKPSQEEQSAINLLKDIVSTPGEYAQVETMTASQRNQLGKALNYIWDTLGEPAQQKLAVTAVMNGENNPKKYILDMLESQTDYSTKTTITPKELPGQTAADKAAKTVALTPQELFHNDKFYRPGMVYEINNPKAGITMKATATGIGPLYSLLKPGEVLSAGTVSKVLTNNNYQAILDPAKAYVGDVKVDPLLMREIAFTGEEVAKVYLPVRADGSPDLGQMESFSKAYQVFDINKDTWTTEQIQKFFRQSGFPNIQIKEVQLPDGTTNKVIGEGGQVKPFLAMPVITNSASDLSDNPWMVEMTGSEKDSAKLLMEEAFTTIGGTPSKPKSTNTMPSSFWSLETPYKGTMFIAYRPESHAIISSMSGHLTGKPATELDVRRNLNFSSASVNPMGIQSSASLLQ